MITIKRLNNINGDWDWAQSPIPIGPILNQYKI